MKVYILLSEVDWSNWIVEKVFLSKEKAEKEKAERQAGDIYSDWRVDEEEVIE